MQTGGTTSNFPIYHTFNLLNILYSPNVPRSSDVVASFQLFNAILQAIKLKFTILLLRHPTAIVGSRQTSKQADRQTDNISTSRYIPYYVGWWGGYLFLQRDFSSTLQSRYFMASQSTTTCGSIGVPSPGSPWLTSIILRFFRNI